jgi:hypothetical protein
MNNNKNQEDLLDLHLPEINIPEIPLSPPSFEMQIAHAKFLLTTKNEFFFQERIHSMNSEAFKWIE